MDGSEHNQFGQRVHLYVGPSALEFVGPRNLGLLTPAGKSARRGPRFGLGWYVNGPSALDQRSNSSLPLP